MEETKSKAPEVNRNLPTFAEPPGKLRNKGGSRPGAGRPRKVDEIAVRRLCQSAIIKKYGSLREGLEALLDGEPGERLYVFQLLLGKAKERIDIGSTHLSKITVEVVETKLINNEPSNDKSISLTNG